MTTDLAVVDLTAEDARQITDRIKVAVEMAWQLIIEAYTRRAWTALGYRSWDDYCTREFGTAHLKLPREDRQEVVSSLHDAGLSTRAIASAIGTSDQTVRADLAQVRDFTHLPEGEPVDPDDNEDESPASFFDEASITVAPTPPSPPAAPSAPPVTEPVPTVTGMDGKTYKAQAKTPAPDKPRRPPLGDSAQKTGMDLRKLVERVERIFADDRFTANKEQVAAHLDGHLSHAVEVFQDLLDRFDHQKESN